MAAVAVDSEYPASDTTITSLIRISNFLHVIRYIAPIIQQLPSAQPNFNKRNMSGDSRRLCGDEFFHYLTLKVPTLVRSRAQPIARTIYLAVAPWIEAEPIQNSGV
jgi:hypothetical protein